MVDILVRTSVIFLVAGAATLLLRRRAASLRHLTWALSIGGALSLPFVSTLSPLRWNVLPAPRSLAAARTNDVVRPASREEANQAGAPIVEETVGEREDEQGAAISPGARNGAADAGSGTPLLDLFSLDGATLAAGGYAAGAVVLLTWLLAGCVIVRRRAVRAVPVRDREWTSALEEVTRDLGLVRAPGLRRSAEVPVPFATGIWNPVIVLPSSSDAWTPSQRRAVLLHEAAHISRGDLAMNLLSYLVRALYWINPMAWIAARRLRVEGEKACDDLVIANGARPSEYADHLLRVVQSTGRRLPTVALAMARGSDFEGRLLSILAPDVPRHRVKRLQLAGATVAAMLAVVGVGVVSPAVAAAPAPLVAPVDADADATEAAAVWSPVGVAERLAERQGEAPRPAGDSQRPAGMQAPSNDRGLLTSPAGSAGQPSRAVDALMSLLVDADASVRLAAVQSLQNLQDPAAIAALAKALKEDTDPRVREAAANALGEIDDTRAVPHLVEALRAERVSKVRARIIDALHELDDPRATPAIIPSLKDSSADVRRSAVSALEGLEDASAVGPLQALVRDPDVEVRRRLASALGSFDDASSLESIITLTRDADAEVRAQAVGALDDIEDARVAPALVAALGDRNADVRERAANGLGSIDGLRSAPRALIDALNDSDGDVRRAAADALGSIGDEAAVPALKRLLTATDVDTRREVVEALKEIGGAEAVESLLGLLKDSDAEVRRMAAEALGKRRGE